MVKARNNHAIAKLKSQRSSTQMKGEVNLPAIRDTSDPRQIYNRAYFKKQNEVSSQSNHSSLMNRQKTERIIKEMAASGASTPNSRNRLPYQNYNTDDHTQAHSALGAHENNKKAGYDAH